MARATPQNLLFDPDKPGSVNDFLTGLWEESQAWRQHCRDMDDLLHNRHAIPEIPGAPMKMTPIYSSVARQQLKAVVGSFTANDMPLANLQVPSENQELLKKVEVLESATQDALKLMERQAKLVWVPTVEDMAKYGVGWEAIEGYTERLSTKGGYPKRAKDQDADAYNQATDEYEKAMGSPGGQLATSWRHVPAQNILWLESQYGGLDVVVEYLETRVSEVMSMRPPGGLPTKFVAAVGKLTSKGTSVGRCTVRYIVIETPTRITHVLDKSLRAPEAAWAGQQAAWDQEYAGGEVVCSYPNPIGKIRYIPSFGLSESSDSQWTSRRGIYTDQASLIKTLDAMMSWWVFDQQCLLAAPVIVQQTRFDPNNPGPLYSEGNDKKVANDFKITPGYHDTVPLPAGYVAEFLTRPRSPEWTEAMDRVERWCMSLGVAIDDVLRDASQSGYAIAQKLATTMVANTLMVRGLEQAAAQRAERYHDWSKYLWNKTKHNPQILRKTDSGFTYAKIDGELLKSLPTMTYDVTFRVKRITDEAAAIQNFLAATAPGPNQALDWNTAHGKYLGTDNVEEVRQRIIKDKILQSPEYLASLVNETIDAMGLLEAEEKRKARNEVKLARMNELTGGAAAAIAEQEQVGSAPAPQAGQMGSAAPPLVPGVPTNGAAPMPPNPLASTGGRAAGQSVMPGGPQLTGGL